MVAAELPPRGRSELADADAATCVMYENTPADRSFGSAAPSTSKVISAPPL
ncbi:MAG: hypothetical protein JF597_52335 [Streptomyces sp.]|uniref:hypothetical protein n=1 Tax=Streptomyces sp. TaxID=1931 RepID=UPI0025F8870C|nr:hypothetical protein [Streptomyces sp.]MBW8801823.1 hypothetical protein [Streptomyces sp.]